MAYLTKYKGKYRIKAHVDESTNDFPRNNLGNIETDDLYIKCANGNQIYHYGRAILVAYIPSIQRGHTILKSLGARLCGWDNEEQKYEYSGLYKALEAEGTIKDIKENDSEIEFKFHSKHIELIAEYLKPSTFGAGISPFSSKNLPKSSYIIPEGELEEYKCIISGISKDNILIISRITNGFITNIVAKSKQYRGKNIKAEMRKTMLKRKEFIHFSGYWNQYIEYLERELRKYEKSSEI